MLRNPGKLNVVSEALLGCFAYEPAGASLLLCAASPNTNYMAKAMLPSRSSKVRSTQNCVQQNLPLSVP